MNFLFNRVIIEGWQAAIPSELVTSEELESKLSPVYQRINLHPGRLELMTGIRERRFFPEGTRSSEIAAEAAEALLNRLNVDPKTLDCVIHTSVCKDFAEPATAAVVHDKLGLKDSCQFFDVSNACLGFLNGMQLVASMIELGQIERGLVVSGEDGRALVESTVKALNEDMSVTRQSIKASIASLTIGAGGAAVLLTSESSAKGGQRLLGGASRGNTEFNRLCVGGEQAGQSTGSQITMSTDSETMLVEGVKLAKRTLDDAFCALSWTQSNLNRVVTHQVGSAHRKALFEALEIDPVIDYPTVETLGNAGSASIGMSVALAASEGVLQQGDSLMLMGIGSGLTCMMMGVQC